MKRVVIVGGGVGGTLVANLIARRLRREWRPGQRDRRGRRRPARLPAGVHVYRHGQRGRGSPCAAEWTLLDSEVRLEVGRRAASRRGGSSWSSWRTEAVCTMTTWCSPPGAHPAGGDRALRVRSAPLLRGRCGAAAEVRARSVHRGAHRHRHRVGEQVPARAAGGGVPDRRRAAAAGPAQAERDPLLQSHRERSRSSRSRRWRRRSWPSGVSSSTRSSTSRPSTPSGGSSPVSRARRCHRNC